MKFEQFKKCFLELRAARAAQDEYLDKIPKDIFEAFFDNEYVNQYDKMINALVANLMTPQQEDWFFYFLYEWSPGYSITSNDKEFNPSNIEEVLEFCRTELEWDK